MISEDRNTILKHCNKISYTGCPVILLQSLFFKALPSQKCKIISHWLWICGCLWF